MKPRLEAVAFDATKPSCCVVEMPRGPHQFRLPPLSVQFRITDLHSQHQDDGRLSTARALERGAVAIGASWCHETDEIEAEYPTEDDDASLVRYARAVQRELEDAGYTASEILYLGTEVLRLMTGRIVEDARARELADFCAARRASPSSP